MKKHIHTEIELEVSAPKAWNVLTDLEKYPDWNPFIQRIEGNTVSGATLRVALKLEGKKEMVFTPRVLVADAPHEFCWKGKLLLPGVFDGMHRFYIRSIDENRCVLVQEETFSGILSGMIFRQIGQATEQAFHAMNQALKTRVEQQPG